MPALVIGGVTVKAVNFRRLPDERGGGVAPWRPAELVPSIAPSSMYFFASATAGSPGSTPQRFAPTLISTSTSYLRWLSTHSPDWSVACASQLPAPNVGDVRKALRAAKPWLRSISGSQFMKPWLMKKTPSPIASRPPERPVGIGRFDKGNRRDIVAAYDDLVTALTTAFTADTAR